MPSTSLLVWRNDRMARLGHVDAQCAASLALVPANPDLVDENLRGYVLLLSAHFQGYCRDIHSESAQVIVSKLRRRLQNLVQEQFTAHRKLDRGNPNIENLKADFGRFVFALDFPAADPANSMRLRHLKELNTWRNVSAHHDIPPQGPPLDLPTIQAWRGSGDGLATSLDGIMYNRLRRILRRKPWIP
jgi:hypothetical protein